MGELHHLPVGSPPRWGGLVASVFTQCLLSIPHAWLSSTEHYGSQSPLALRYGAVCCYLPYPFLRRSRNSPEYLRMVHFCPTSLEPSTAFDPHSTVTTTTQRSDNNIKLSPPTLPSQHFTPLAAIKWHGTKWIISKAPYRYPYVALYDDHCIYVVELTDDGQDIWISTLSGSLCVSEMHDGMRVFVPPDVVLCVARLCVQASTMCKYTRTLQQRRVVRQNFKITTASREMWRQLSRL